MRLVGAAAGNFTATITARETTTATLSGTSGTTIACTVPAATVAGDLLVAVWASEGGTLGTPTLWTKFIDLSTGGGPYLVFGGWYKVAQAGDASSSVTFTVSSGGLNTSGHMIMTTYGSQASQTSPLGTVSAVGTGTTISTNGPSSFLGRRPFRVDVFAGRGSSAPTLSSYTGTGALLSSGTYASGGAGTNQGRLSVYAGYSNSSAATQVSSSANDLYGSAAFSIRSA